MINKILEMQPTEENPYIVDSYPYGRLRCIAKFWVESVKDKGDRWVMQTQNPKTLRWNKPKKSTYSAVVVAYIDEKEHITYKSCWRSTDPEEYKSFMEFIGSEDILNELQRNELKLIRAYIKAYSGVTFKIVEGNLSEEEQEKHDKKQDEIKKQISNEVAYNYIHDDGGLNDD